MSHSVVSDLGLNCLPITLLGVSRLKWAKNSWTLAYSDQTTYLISAIGIDHEIPVIVLVTLHLLLIQEGQLSATDRSM